MTPPVALVHRTAAPKPPAMPVHPDTRTAAVADAAILAARNVGYRRGERVGLLAGWRSGWLCGLCWGCALTGIAAAAARAWGWL